MWSPPSRCLFTFVFFNDTATTEIYTLSLHDALPIWGPGRRSPWQSRAPGGHSADPASSGGYRIAPQASHPSTTVRSEEHTSELQSRQYLVCRLLLEKKKIKTHTMTCPKGHRTAPTAR